MTIQEFQLSPSAPVMLRPSQVVKRYSLPRDRLYKAINNGELPAYDVGSAKRPAFLLEDAAVLSWIKSLPVVSK